MITQSIIDEIAEMSGEKRENIIINMIIERKKEISEIMSELKDLEKYSSNSIMLLGGIDDGKRIYNHGETVSCG
jgi:replicative DNA helicase